MRFSEVALSLIPTKPGDRVKTDRYELGATLERETALVRDVTRVGTQAWS